MPKRILLADDSITIQKVVELTFSDGDYQIVAASNGAKAIQKLTEWRPDIILSDIIMPEKNGYEVCEYVKSHPEYRDIPVVLLTGTFEPFDPDRAEKAGCDAVVTKPFESQSLIHKVEELIAQRRSAPSAPQPPSQRAPETFSPARDMPALESPTAVPQTGGTLPWRMPEFAPAGGETEVFASTPAAEESAPFVETTPWRESTEELPVQNAAPAEPEPEPFEPFGGGVVTEDLEQEPESTESVFAADADAPTSASPRWELDTSPSEPTPGYTGETQAFPMVSSGDANQFQTEAESQSAAAPRLEVDHSWAETASSPEEVSETPAETMGRTLPFPRIPEPSEQDESAPATDDVAPETNQRESEQFSEQFEGEQEPAVGSDQSSMSAEPFADTSWSDEEEVETIPRDIEIDIAEGAAVVSPFSDGEQNYASAPESAPEQEEISDEAAPWGLASDSTPLAETVVEEMPEEAWDSADVASDIPMSETGSLETVVESEQPEYAETLAAVEPEPTARPASFSSQLSEDDIERIARRVVELMSEQTVKNIAWEVIPDMAEIVVRERIRELENQT